MACSDICQKVGLQNETIDIFSDSKNISLQVLSNLNRVYLSWVPGHCNIAGNKMTDKLAREGCNPLLTWACSAAVEMHGSVDNEKENAQLNNCAARRVRADVWKNQTSFLLNQIQIPSPRSLSPVRGLLIRPELRPACRSQPRLHPPKSIHPWVIKEMVE
jgi:RNase H